MPRKVRQKLDRGVGVRKPHNQELGFSSPNASRTENALTCILDFWSGCVLTCPR